jgi:hypothetical protein
MHHFIVTAREVRARGSARHQPALAVRTVAEECNLRRQKLLFDVLVTKAAKSTTAPSVYSADIGEAGAMHRPAGHVDDPLTEYFSRLMHYKRVYEIKSQLSGSFDALTRFA